MHSRGYSSEEISEDDSDENEDSLREKFLKSKRKLKQAHNTVSSLIQQVFKYNFLNIRSHNTNQ